MILSFLDAKEHFLHCEGRTKSCIHCCKEIIKKHYPLHVNLIIYKKENLLWSIRPLSSR